MAAEVAEVRALVYAPPSERDARKKELIASLFQRHRRSLLWYLTRLIPNRADAEEVAQEAFVRLLGVPHLETDAGRARNYLFATATNLARDNYRRRSARAATAHVPLDELQLEAEDPEPERLVDAARGRRIVDSVLRDLQPRPRQAFLKYVYEELTYERIAHDLGVSKKTIERDIGLTVALCRSRLTRGLEHNGAAACRKPTESRGIRCSGLLAIVAIVLAAVAEPAAAQTNLIGYWNPIFHEDVDERIPGPSIGDYLGLPITAAARQRAEAWDASLLSNPEHQCKPHPSTYGFRGVGVLRIWEDRDEDTQQLVKIHTHIAWQEQHREIWMDGRPHPPDYAPHTWQGFSTGSWDGDVLVVETTHLKAGWMRRNGLPLSDRATMTDRFHRYGDLMTHVMIVEDPVYLTEPLVKTNGFLLQPAGTMTPYPCDPVIEIVRDPGYVPHYLPGQNPFIAEFGDTHGLPREATRGGAATALPEFAETLR